MVVGCLPLSQKPGRCGPLWGRRCNKNLRSYAVYCNVDSGWCGATEAHNNAQPGDTYDWETTLCQGNRFPHNIPYFTLANHILTSYFRTP